MADWQTAPETVAAAYARGTLEKDARTISEAYRLKTGEGRRLLTRKSEAAAYALSRMPATVEAAKAALTEALAATGLAPKTLLDCGAGTGAVTFAADALLGLERATCLERETAMRAVGQQLMREAGGVQAEWAACDLTAKERFRAPGWCARLYARRAGSFHAAACGRKLWDACEQMLVLIEPGTPQGFANLRAAREALTGRGAYVAAPCPEGSAACPMTGDNWCHFCRPRAADAAA
ncbi:MAG: small ribosomal subunit Rsm22 family protein [Christensenellales bacterium]